MIAYVESAEGIRPENITGFFEGWRKKPTPEAHLRILSGSDHVILAMDDRRVVGFITAITDGVACAYIPLLEVLPEHRRCGIGAELVRRIVARLQTLYMVDLLCDEALLPFYKRLGFQAVRGACIRSFDRIPL